MKQNFYVIVMMMLLAFFSCRTNKTAQTSGYTPPTESTQTENPVTMTTDQSGQNNDQIVIRTEQVDLLQGEDLSKGQYAYYVIIGSFSSLENARSLKSQLLEKGMIPVLLQSETGMFRVSVNQTNLEKEARSVISDIRTRYPEHQDIWLLKKK